MSSLTNSPNLEITTLNTTAIKENLNYIAKFKLPADVAQQINSRFILNDDDIDDSTIMSDIKLNS